LLAPLLAAAAIAVGCGGRGDKPDLVRGKALFIQKCGACHTLARAGTKGIQGPNLDAAFAEARAQGFRGSGIQGVVRDQISHVRRGSIMPLNLVTGEAARDVAAYVASAAANPGQDTGALATAGRGGGGNNGKAIFTSNGCNSCHTLAAAGATATVGPNLNTLKSSASRYGKQLHQTPEQYVTQSIKDPDVFVVPGYPKGVMPSNFGSSLKPRQIAALVKFLLSVSH
jgi:mono/diheme cytochrome c family protein